MIEGIVTDVLTLLQIVHDTVQGVKANSVARNVLLARIESLQAIISTIQTPALDSPVSSALLDIKETVQNIADAVGSQQKRGWAQKALKVSIEASELSRLDQRLSAGQQQLCLAINTENVGQAIKNAQEVETIFSSKSKSLPGIITDNFEHYQDRIDRHRDKLDSLTKKLQRLYPSMERYPAPLVPPHAPLDMAPGLGIGGISSLIRLGGTIISLVQGAKNNREEAFSIGRRVQVVLDVIESLNSDLMNRRVRRDEVDALMSCLQKCAEVVADQTAKGAGKRALDVQSDRSKLKDLEKELTDCLVRLGIDLQLHQKSLDTELMFNVTANISRLEKDVIKASNNTSENISASIRMAEHGAERLQWVIDRAPFYSTASGDQIRDFSEHPSMLINRVDCSAISLDIKPLSVNKGFTAVTVGPDWRELHVAIGRVIHVYDFGSGEHQFEVGRHQGAVGALGISSDKCKLLSYGQDHAIKLWDVMKRKELSSFSPIQSCSEVQFTAGPEYHVATHNHTSTQVFARTNTQQRIYYHGDATFVLSADGSVMAVRGTMGVPIISTPSMTVVRAVPWGSRPGKIALSAIGQYLYVRANFSAEAAIFRLEDGSKLPAISLDGSETEEQFCTDSRTEEVRLVAGTRGGSIKIWDIFSGSLYKELSDSSQEASPVCSVSVTEIFSCGILVASLDVGGLVRLWDVDTGTCLSKLGVGMDFIFSGMSGGSVHYFVMVSPDGLRLVVRRRELTAICMLHGLANALTKPKEVSET